LTTLQVKPCMRNKKNPLGYAAPYSHLVCDQPSKEIMRTVVVCKNMRPRIRPILMDDNVGKFFVQMIVEMWEKGEEKLTI